MARRCGCVSWQRALAVRCPRRRGGRHVLQLGHGFVRYQHRQNRQPLSSKTGSSARRGQPRHTSEGVQMGRCATPSKQPGWNTQAVRRAPAHQQPLPQSLGDTPHLGHNRGACSSWLKRRSPNGSRPHFPQPHITVAAPALQRSHTQRTCVPQGSAGLPCLRCRGQRLAAGLRYPPRQ